MPDSESRNILIKDENIYVIEQTSDMELEELIDKIKAKVQEVLSDDPNSKQTNHF